MQYLLVASDWTNVGVLKRRMKVRDEHLRQISVLNKNGRFVCGGAVLDENGKMTGSMIVYDFPDMEALKESLRNEVYMTEIVWEKVEIRPFRMALIH
jgi:uncharacterized protein